MAAVFRTYGSVSCRAFLRGSIKAEIIVDDVIEDIVRTARARIKGFRSLQSCGINPEVLLAFNCGQNGVQYVLTDKKPGIAWAISSDFDRA